MTEIIIILNLFILETLLSIDNAAVLAIMVKDLPVIQRSKALRYGLLGAFVFRGICLILASWLVKITFLKVLGGAYLIWLSCKHFLSKSEENATPNNYRVFGLNIFWSTVVMVEVMDIAFSLDNVFAAVAFTNNIWLIMTGVFLGIISMRFIAQKFVSLISKYPSLTTSAFIVILLLGIKLIASVIMPSLGSHEFDLWFSGLMMLIFFAPLIKK